MEEDPDPRFVGYRGILENPPAPAPAPENNNPKVFQCISDYISNKNTKYYPNDGYKVHYVNGIPRYGTFSVIKYYQVTDVQQVKNLIKGTVGKIDKLVKEDGELVDGYGTVKGIRKTPLMIAVSFKGIDIEVVKALLENGANVNVKDLFYCSEMANKFTDDRPTLLKYAADNLAYMGQEIARGGILFNNVVNIKLCDNDNKSILAYIISNYNGYVDSVKELVYKVIEEDEENIGNYYDNLINQIGEVTLDDVEKCLMNTAEKGAQNCKYTQFLDRHIEKIRKYEIDYEELKKNIKRPEKTKDDRQAEFEKKQAEKDKTDLFVTAEARKLIYDFINKFLDHKDIVYIINQEWKDNNTIVSCLGLLLDFYKENESEITLKLIEKCLKKGADFSRVLYKIFDFDDPLKILTFLDTNVDVTVRLIVSRDETCGEKGGFRAPYDNFLTYTIIKKNIPVLEFILDKLDKLGDHDKVVNCILSPNYYNTTSITAAGKKINDDNESKELKEVLEEFLKKCMGYDRRILIHGLKYAVESNNLNLFNVCMRVNESNKEFESLSIVDITNLLKDMTIPVEIERAIKAVPGGEDANAAGQDFHDRIRIGYKRSGDAINQTPPMKPRTSYGAKKRRSNRLAPTRKRVVKRRSLKKK